MSSKHERLNAILKASIVKWGIICVGLGLALAGVYYTYGGLQEDTKQLKKRDQQIKSQIINLRQRNERAANTLKRYNDLTKDADLRSLELDRKTISKMLNELSTKYQSMDVSINIQPPEEQTKAPFVRSTGTIITAPIAISYQSPSDIQALAFLEELLSSFSGYLNIRRFSIVRESEISQQLLQQLLRNGRGDFVSLEVEFDWLGLRPNQEEAKDKGGAS